MTVDYCDRCARDITGRKSGAILGIPDADADSNGAIKNKAMFCPRCYRLLWTILRTKIAIVAKPRPRR